MANTEAVVAGADATKTEGTADVAATEKSTSTATEAVKPGTALGDVATTADVDAKKVEAAKDDAGVAPFTDLKQLTAPEGAKYDEKLMGEFLPIAKELGLNVKQVQSLTAWQTKVSAGIQAAQEKVAADRQAANVAALKADPEIGGAKYDESMAFAKVALRRFGSPELAKLLTENPDLGDSPAMARFLVKLGKAQREDTVGGSVNGAVKTPANDSETYLKDAFPETYKYLQGS